MALRRVLRVLPALPALVALAAPLPAASAASAATWPARTVATGGPAFHRDVVGLPNGTIGTLLKRHAGRSSRLELWVGTRRTLVARSASGHFFEAHLAADARGRFVVAYTVVPEGGGARQAFAWTTAGGLQRLTSGTHSVTTTDVAVAPSGRAVVTAALASAQTVAVARGTTAAGFGATIADVSGGQGDFPADVGIADDGTVTVAWQAWQRHAVALARTAWGAAFGAPVTVAVPDMDEIALAVTAGGRAVVAVKQTDKLLSGAFTRDVETFTWEPGAAAPGAPTVVSQGQAGAPVALAVGERAFVLWRQARTTRTAPSTLGVAVFDGATATAPAGTPRVRLTAPGRGGAGGLLGRLAVAPSGTGVRPYFTVGGSTHTTHVDTTGRVSGTSVALGPADGGSLLAAAEAGGRPVVVWTRQMFGGNAGYRVRIARPSS